MLILLGVLAVLAMVEILYLVAISTPYNGH